MAILLSTSLFLGSFGISSTSKPEPILLSSHQISLENRYENTFVNNVFKDNILLNLAYMRRIIDNPKKIDWDNIRKPFTYNLSINPGKTFAFHDDVLDKYKNTLETTTNAHFNFQEGFKSDGYLFGDGVCHLASFIYLAAKTAGLDTYAPTNHNFAVIPEINREYGVSIYSNPGSKSANARQNLYVSNNTEAVIKLRFFYDGKNLKLSVIMSKNSGLAKSENFLIN